MKVFLVKLLVFFVSLFLFDYIFGVTFDNITKRIVVGGSGKDNYICDKLNDDFLVFGSSRAERHYNTKMISDSLKVTAYNCGEGGCGIIHAYGRLIMILENHSPQTILYDVTPNLDLLKGNNIKELYRLKQHYDRPGIDSIIEDVSPAMKYKLLSGMYRHNSSFLQNFIAFMGYSFDSGTKGFRPINKSFDTLRIQKNYIINSKEGYDYDSIKIKYVRKFINACNKRNINLIFLTSPIWYVHDSKVLEPIIQICHENQIPFVDFSKSSKFTQNNYYFRDGKHLNSRGANEYTHDLINYLRRNGANYN